MRVPKHAPTEVVYFIPMFKQNLLKSRNITGFESVDEAQIICFIRVYHLFGPVCISISKDDH
jgi:hypothetical protein